MGKVILLPSIEKKIIEQQNNIELLKILIEKYIPENKSFVLNKIKNEQKAIYL